MTVKRHAGFTLIEILIVIVIIGITVGFALIAYGDFGASRRVLFAAEQLVNTLKLAQQQAILETSTMGLRIDSSSYQILKFKNDSNWSPISDRGIFKVTYFPKNTVVTLQTSTRAPLGLPSIVINSSGDMTPFNLNFTANKQTIAIVNGSHDGNITINVNPKK